MQLYWNPWEEHGTPAMTEQHHARSVVHLSATVRDNKETRGPPVLEKTLRAWTTLWCGQTAE